MLELESLLEKWTTNDRAGQTDHQAALKILEATELIFEGNQAETLQRSSWFNFLDVTKKPYFLK